MNWILDNLQIFVFLVVVAVWIVRSIMGKHKTEGEGSAHAPPTVEDPAAAERTRQIQEEIRRRILARQRGENTVAPAPVAPPRPVVMYQEEEPEPPEVEEEEYREEGPRAPMPTAAAHRRADVAQAAILEQQRQLAEQLHALRAARAAGGSVTPRPAISLPRDAAAAIAAHQTICGRDLRRDLRHSTSVRRAILLKEILGEPVALQRGR